MKSAPAPSTPSAEQTSALGIDDRRHLDAAEGWAGLGDYKEAQNELQSISPARQVHPEV